MVSKLLENNNKRIVKNTLLLYVRQLLILIVSLYTVRVVLSTLGVVDYGIYNVIGGIVLLLSFLRGTMASATQRFFSFALGQKDQFKLNKTFCVNFAIYLVISIIAVISLESIGLYFVKNQLNIPVERLNSAITVFHFSVLTFITTIFITPFIAIIIAHEDMKFYTYISIVEVLMKLAIVFLLIWLPWDKLEIYAILTFLVSLILVFVYFIFSVKKYPECQFKKIYWDKTLLYEIVGFTGWTLFGQVTTVIRTQAITILLNQMFSPVIVAARAIATSVTNQINIFSNNFNIGLYPPIIKYYAADEKDEMFKLIYNGSKITFFLMWAFALPLFLQMDIILSAWLDNVPEYTVLFTRLALIEVLINSISLPLATSARAPGKMKLYELTLGSIQIIIFIIAYILLKNGEEAYSVYVVTIIANFFMFFIRLILVKYLIGLPFMNFIKKVVLPVVKIMIISGALSLYLKQILSSGIVFSAISIVLSIIISFITMYYVGLNKIWRERVRQLLYKKLNNLVGR